MKILLIGPAHPYRGGIATLNDRLALELQSQGHDIEIISFKVQYPSFLFPGKTQFTDSPKPHTVPILQLIHSYNPFNWFRTARKLKSKSPDLIIVRYWLPFMAPSTGTLCKLLRSDNAKVIAITDNIIPHEKRIGDRILTKYFTNQADGFLAMSRSVYNELDGFIGKKPKALSPHPIYDHYGDILQREEAIARLGLSPKFRYILFFGFIREYKGLDVLLEAFAKKNLKEFPLKLIVAGEYYSNEERYSQLIKNLSLEDRVILKTDYIPDNEVNLYFCASDLIAQPYKSATQSGVTQVAYHFNKPMLVTNVGGLSEIVDHDLNGYVVEPTPEAVNQAIANFFSRDRLQEMTKNVIIAKERYSWKTFSNAIFDLYKQIKK
jgi:D-inositol-3-phosphate glycosyltransferase